MKTVDLVIIGGGPAGLTAAISAVSSGSKVILFERSPRIGGQLIKQTHMFFGSEKQYASHRGFKITEYLLEELDKYKDLVKIYTNSTVLGIYEDGVISVEADGKYIKVLPKRVIVATGASEKIIAFPGNDLPGVYGAGAVQTLMNVYGVKPADKVLMIGAGNIGLIVSYQLMQAGVEVEAIITDLFITGYHVHASKIARMGVPILSGYTVKEVIGEEKVEKAVISKIDDKWNIIEGTDIEYDVDAVCLSVGLSPLVELLGQAGCELRYISELGGFVPLRDNNYRTTNSNIFIAGDITGIEEASSAMVEGYIAGLTASKDIGNIHEKYDELLEDYRSQLNDLRSGPHSGRLRNGIAKLMGVLDNV
ncbi:MAG: FAD-dependent oxidoreductase [Clostridiales bacterium]|nr:FAD-dependent oxidoreductase [Clostridiales bacterium]